MHSTLQLQMVGCSFAANAVASKQSENLGRFAQGPLRLVADVRVGWSERLGLIGSPRSAIHGRNGSTNQLTPFRRYGWNVRSRRNPLFATLTAAAGQLAVQSMPHPTLVAVRPHRLLLAAAPTPYAGQDLAHARRRAYQQSALPHRTCPMKPLPIITHTKALPVGIELVFPICTA